MRLIDADELFERVGVIKPNSVTQYADIGMFMNMITNSPTVFIPNAKLDTTNDFAEWIDVNGDGSLWKCSRCGETSCCRGKYCCECGADMRVKNELNRVSKELNSDNTTLLYSMTNGDNFIGKEGDRNDGLVSL